MSPDNSPLRAVVVGCRMGRAHAAAIAHLEEYELAAVCDLKKGVAERAAQRAGGDAAIYTDAETMFAEVKPDVVSIATPNDSHAELTRKAVEAGAKGVYCEKPMATCIAEARDMADVCRSNGVALAINHQRRTSAPYRTMRRLIEEGTLGEVYLIRGSCAGDFLSDGTHTVDSILHLAGDAQVRWVLGQLYREAPDESREQSGGYHASGGYRFGHPIESGAMATFEFATGVRAEVLSGGMRFPGRAYQDIEVFGTEGRLWRGGDRPHPPVAILDGQGGGWRPVELDDPAGLDGCDNVISGSYRAFARMIREGAYHPLCVENALRGFEVVMAVYESARLNARVELPLQQDEFPLAMMIQQGRL